MKGGNDGDSQASSNNRKDSDDIIHPSDNRALVGESESITPTHSPENMAHNIEVTKQGHKRSKSSDDIGRDTSIIQVGAQDQLDVPLTTAFNSTEIPEQEVWLLDPMSENFENQDEMPDPEDFPEIFQLTAEGSENRPEELPEPEEVLDSDGSPEISGIPAEDPSNENNTCGDVSDVVLSETLSEIYDEIGITPPEVRSAKYRRNNGSAQ